MLFGIIIDIFKLLISKWTDIQFSHPNVMVKVKRVKKTVGRVERIESASRAHRERIESASRAHRC